MVNWAGFCCQAQGYTDGQIAGQEVAFPQALLPGAQVGLEHSGQANLSGRRICTFDVLHWQSACPRAARVRASVGFGSHGGLAPGEDRGQEEVTPESWTKPGLKPNQVHDNLS